MSHPSASRRASGDNERSSKPAIAYSVKVTGEPGGAHAMRELPEPETCGVPQCRCLGARVEASWRMRPIVRRRAGPSQAESVRERGDRNRALRRPAPDRWLGISAARSVASDRRSIAART
jgi:hypothetical protein